MKKIFYLLGITALVSCSTTSSFNKFKFKNVGSVSITANTNDINLKLNGNDTNSILNKKVSLSSLLNRRLSSGSNGSFFAVIIDSIRNSYIEASILRHNDMNIVFHIHQSSLNKKDTFDFDIAFNLSDLKVKSYKQNSDNSYSLSFTTSKSDTVNTFQFAKTSNFVIQEGILELMTGEILNPEGNKVKFIALNDLHDVFESLTGLCFISVPNMTLLRLQCKDMAVNYKCPKGLKPYYAVIERNYFFARDYYCQVDCK